VGSEVKPTDRVALKVGAALYWYMGVEGKASSPCNTTLKTVSCDTDPTRPSFAQKGNTYRTIRTPSADALAIDTPPGSAPQYQYFGLVTPFHQLALTGRIDLKALQQLDVALDGEWVRNLALRPSRIRGDPLASSADPLALNNVACTGGRCRYAGGSDAYTARLVVGSPTQGKRWSWSAWFGYRYLESDAVLDAFTDSDFGLGGTNLKGVVSGVTLAPVDGVTVGARWYSATEVAGFPYAVDVFQLDLGTRF
jgi:hypothetical protein